LHIVYNCFHDTTVELMIATEDHMAGKAWNTYHLTLYKLYPILNGTVLESSCITYVRH
jgi:hypothetical protein